MPADKHDFVDDVCCVCKKRLDTTSFLIWDWFVSYGKAAVICQTCRREAGVRNPLIPETALIPVDEWFITCNLDLLGLVHRYSELHASVYDFEVI
jgi:hypothetical protein